MFITYHTFIQKLESRIKDNQGEYKDIVEKVIQYPHRYIGLFRVTNTKSKLIQNLSQSREIRFGNFLEEIVGDIFLFRVLGIFIKPY